MRRTALAPALLLAATVAAAPLTSAPAPAPVAALALKPCTIPGLEREVRCGTLDVFEDRAARKGRTIPLRIVVLPATGGEARMPDPIFVLAGGPGQAAVRQAAGVGHAWADTVNRRHDVVLVDVRGTGESNGLYCRGLDGDGSAVGFMESFLPVAGVRACRAELLGKADLRLYTSANIVDDLDEVRAALGYDRIDLTGGSYGTYAALTYMRRHPEHVRTADLEGVVPPDARMPLTFARDAQDAFDLVARDCAADAACRAAFPDVPGDLQKALDRLQAQPVPVEARDANTGQAVRFRLSRSAAAQTVRYMLYAPVLAAQIPLQLHLAAGGDPGRLGETAYMVGQMMTGDAADGLYLSVTCAEDVPFFTMAEAEAAARGTFLGTFRAQAQKDACAEWPRGEVAQNEAEPVRSDAPVLLGSGERDPVTPPRWAREVAATLPNALSFVVRGGGHGADGIAGAEECLDRIYADFVDRGTTEGLDTTCVSALQPVPFALKDERAAAVTLTPAELDRFAGTYVGDGGAQIVVRRTDNGLQAVIREGLTPALTPVGPTRFRIEGAPDGFYAEFTVEGGRVTGMVMEEGPGQKDHFMRK
jgi:pimeloyl-ACP methyl ester carboxylesterase